MKLVKLAFSKRTVEDPITRQTLDVLVKEKFDFVSYHGIRGPFDIEPVNVSDHVDPIDGEGSPRNPMSNNRFVIGIELVQSGGMEVNFDSPRGL